MIGDAPPFWWIQGDWRGYALWPFGLIYGAISGRRMTGIVPPEVDLPVICVGNFTVGGSGKTPTVIALARRATEMGRKPAILTRGYGGSHHGPHLVDIDHDDARSVGDEAMLLARHVPVMISVDRITGAKALEAQGFDIIFMDDGFQSNRIAIDFALAVIDAGRGIGNGFVLPAGPVRVPMKVQLKATDALLVMGQGDGADAVVRSAARAAKPIVTAKLKASNVNAIAGKRLLAFAGIGDPGRFYNMLGALGGDVVRTRDFPDHYMFRDDDLIGLMAEAEDNGLLLVTTEKDAMRLNGHSPQQVEMRQRMTILPVEAIIQQSEMVDGFIAKADENAAKRRLARSETNSENKI